MKLYRFCSNDELKSIQNHQAIHNYTDHYNCGAGGSTSVGFCLTEDEPDEAWKYLKGIVTPGVCVRYDVPHQFLTPSKGKYACMPELTTEGHVIIKSMIKNEWCTTTLLPEWFRETIPLEHFVPDYELSTARYFDRIKRNIQVLNP